MSKVFFLRQLFQICKFTKLFSNNLEFFNNSRNFLPSLFQYGFSVASVKSSTLDHGDHGLSIESEGWDTFIHVEKMLRATQFGLQKVNHSAVTGKMVLYYSDLKKQRLFLLIFILFTNLNSFKKRLASSFRGLLTLQWFKYKQAFWKDCIHFRHCIDKAKMCLKNSHTYLQSWSKRVK